MIQAGAVGSAVLAPPDLLIRPWTGDTVDYTSCLQEMREYTTTRQDDSPDQIWLVQHPAVFTMGLAAKAEHLLTPGDIPVIHTERGGQVTYHGPGQVVMYVMLNLRRWGITVRGLVSRLEQAAIATLADYGIAAQARSDAPGVYLQVPSGPQAGAKIAALGLKVSRGYSFHGLALNVAMDLAPFERINPCGYPGLIVTDMRSCLSSTPEVAQISQTLVHHLIRELRSPALTPVVESKHV